MAELLDFDPVSCPRDEIDETAGEEISRRRDPDVSPAKALMRLNQSLRARRERVGPAPRAGENLAFQSSRTLARFNK
jgi:hypothetical protein